MALGRQKCIQPSHGTWTQFFGNWNCYWSNSGRTDISRKENPESY